MRIVSHPEAGQELESAALWYEQYQSGLGDDFLDEFERTLGRIVAEPERWRKMRGDNRKLNFHRWPDPTEWDAEEPNSPELLSDEVKAHAVPMFERFASLDEVIRCLQSLRPIQLPFIIDPRDWILVLASGLAIRDGNRAAVQMLERRITLLEKSPESSDRRICPPLRAFRDRLIVE